MLEDLKLQDLICCKRLEDLKLHDLKSSNRLEDLQQGLQGLNRKRLQDLNRKRLQGLTRKITRPKIVAKVRRPTVTK